ncbi:hypothetical protein Tco_0717906 [Tanacetum coccineum]
MMQTNRGDGVTSIKRRRRDLSSDGVKDFTTTSRRNRLKSDLEDSTRCIAWIFKIGIKSQGYKEPDSSEESMGTSNARVILFGTIPTTVLATTPTANLPVIHDDTPLIPTDTPTISPIVPTIPPIAPTIQYTSPFVCTDSSHSNTSERPPSQDLYEVTVAQGRSRVAASSSPPSPPVLQILPAPLGLPRRLAILVLPWQPIPVGRPYHSSSETSSDSHSDASSNSSSRHSSSGYAISDSHCASSTVISAGPSRKRCRSPTTLVPMRGALSPIRANLLSPHKRVRDSDSVTDFEADMNDCIAIADDIAARGTDVRVEIGDMAEEEVESSARGMIKIGVDLVTHLVVSDDIVEPVREDFPELVSNNGSLEVMQRGLDVVMQELYDHMMEIPVHRVRVIESV